jgi:tRNA pseudouridine32 synthase/23S rRNA pseudouridine746 synthase
LTLTLTHKNIFFHSFETPVASCEVPAGFRMMSNGTPHPLCLLAAKELQEYLKTQEEWHHNFGLSTEKEGPVIGKMFGVLAVKNSVDEIGYLAAFSGKIAGSNHHSKFVPPVFDLLTNGSFLNQGMEKLTRINQEIKALESLQSHADKEIVRLKAARRAHSTALQNEIYDHYHFLNKAGDEKSLRAIFKAAGYKNPPSGAGECAGPKLLQYAFQHNMKPLAIAEFWWGQSPKSAFWKHGHFYPCCKEKCEPILTHMLSGIDL